MEGLDPAAVKVELDPVAQSSRNHRIHAAPESPSVRRSDLLLRRATDSFRHSSDRSRMLCGAAAWACCCSFSVVFLCIWFIGNRNSVRR